MVGQIADYGIGGFSRAELGRATWKYFHTVMARFPEKPTEDQKEALRSYIYLFARLYPWYWDSFLTCSMPDRGLTVDDISGECAEHFMQHLSKYPPQVSSRNAASGWACFVHNEVNAMLGKPEFDCANLGESYDCGCGGDEEGSEGKEGLAASRSDAGKGSPEHHDGPAVEISKEELVTSPASILTA